MPIQMVCDSTPLVSAAIRDSLSATTAGNGRSAATGATASSSSSSSAAGFSALNHNGVNGNSGGSGGPSGTPTTSLSSSSLAAGAVSALNGGGGKLFRRAMLESSNHGNDDELQEDADGANDLVETISQSLRQGQQVKPITYEEGPSYSASLDKLKSKYIVLKATAPQSDEAGGGEAGATAAASGGSPPNGASTGQQMHHPSPKLSLTTTSAAAAGGMMGKIPTAVTGATMNGGGGGGGGGGGALKFGSSGTPHKSAPTGRPTNHNGVGTGTTGSSVTGKDTASLPAPKRTLFPRENVQVGWKTTGRKWQVGAGMINMGNTCYLNSTLQALFHVPAIANWLVSDVQHRARCDDGGSGGSCIICAMAKTLLDSQSNQSAIKPHLVYSKLRLVCKHLVPGRQEDAHEFLRYLVEAMEKSFLGRYKNSKELDQYSKETTPLNQILGGYLRSEVKCLSCHHISTTFQHFEDLLLDIRRANSIDEALKLYFDRERLEELSYNCEACKKRVAATKQFSLERAPFVLCVQLKRFTINGTKINKHVELRSQLDLTPYSSSSSQQQHQRSGGGSSSSGMLTYRLTSMVTHLGTSQHCGHYTAIGQTEGGAYHVFDDSSVRPVGMHNVMSTNAYILFYELDSPAGAAVGLLNGTTKANQVAGHPSSTVTLSSMGALANGSVTLTSAMSSSAGASGGGGAGSTGTPRKGTHNSTPSPLRVPGSGNSGTGSAGGSIFPSKLDTKPGFIGPVLPASISSSNSNNNNPSNQAGTSPATTVTAATSSSTKTGAAGTAIGPTGISRPGSSASSSTSSLSPPSATGTPSSSPIKSVTNSSLSHPNKIHLKMSQTATQSPSAGGQALNTAKLNGIGSKQSPQVGAAATATQLPSLPKLSLGPVNNGSSRPGNSKPVTAANGGVGSNSISLVPYETDDESDNANNSSSEEEEQQQQQTCTTKRTKQQQNGKLVLKRRSSDEDDDDEDDDDGDRHSHSPQIIKTTAGAWKVSKSNENDKPTYPESSSSSSSSAGSSKESSPVASPAQQQQQHMHAPNGGSSASNGGNKNGHRNGVKSRSSSPPNAAAAAAGSNGGNGGTSSDTGPAAVQLLLKYSHRGYGAPVKSWGGQQTEMDRELANERREERKRQLADDRETEMDRGRTKKVKNLGGAGTNGSHQHQHGNQFQHFQNYQNGGGMKWNGGGNGNRNGNQQQYGNHHHNYHRGGGGGGYYHHRQGFRNNGGAGGGGRRFGGRNGGGFHAKAHHHHHHHHYRSEASSGAGGMASSSSSGGGASGSGNSNGFYHR